VWGYSITWTEHQLAEFSQSHDKCNNECRQLDIGVQKAILFLFRKKKKSGVSKRKKGIVLILSFGAPRLFFLRKKEKAGVGNPRSPVFLFNKEDRYLITMAAADLIINDTLQLTKAQGFPDKLELNCEYRFEKDKRRLYRLPPARVFLAHNIDGKWDYRGEALITELTILPLQEKTNGKFKVVKLYSEEHRKVLNANQQPAEY